jgi:hypothetical protein
MPFPGYVALQVSSRCLVQVIADFLNRMNRFFMAVVFFISTLPVCADQLDQAPFDVSVPNMEFHEMSLTECLNVLRKYLPPGYRIRYVADPTELCGFSPQIWPKPTPRLNLISLNLTDAPLGVALRVIACSAGARIYESDKNISIFPDVGTMEPFETKAYLWTSDQGDFEAALKHFNIPFYSQTKIVHSKDKFLLTAPREVHDMIARLTD